jgi:hypothetical protein
MSAMTFAARALVVTFLSAAPSGAFALCSGFTDVDGASAQCPSVDWLRNREVTLGCTSTTLYCPGQSVLRLSMAAFMNRLGNALTPAVVTQQGGAGSLPLSAPAVVCDTGAIAATAYPRSANVIGVVNTQGPVAVTMHVVYSSNGGATWTAATQAAPGLSAATGWVNGVVQKSAIPLEGAATYRLAMRLDPQAGTTQLGSWSCHLKAELASRTGTGAPY